MRSLRPFVADDSNTNPEVLCYHHTISTPIFEIGGKIKHYPRFVKFGITRAEQNMHEVSNSYHIFNTFSLYLSSPLVPQK
mmetsp:Transcript_7253/g.9686  ORF Transcript_7253/g.9686 Transcript_7253/m.9686 type:complete len:80 (+) Transcript_7253:161-400(+)